MNEGPVYSLRETPFHLGLGATVVAQETFDGDLAWYERYSERHAADGIEGRLLTVHSFDAPWSVWEMHPLGEELVVCLEGSFTLFQEIDGAVRSSTLNSDEAIVNTAGTWHTADVEGSATALFVTAGTGTQHRPR